MRIQHSLQDYEPQIFAQLADDELTRRLQKLRPCMFYTPKGSQQKFLMRTEYPTDSSRAYMWNPRPIETLGLSVGGCVISLRDAPQVHTRLVRLREVTRHRFAYHGFFKPDLVEVASQLPASVFEDFDEVFVLTDLLHPEPSVCCPTQSFHLGITYFWLPCDPNSCEFTHVQFTRSLTPETDSCALAAAQQMVSM